MSTVLLILCIILLVIVSALVRQNSKLRDNNINLDIYQVQAAGVHTRVVHDLDHRLHAAVTALMRELISHGETMAAHLTLEAEHTSLKQAHEFLWQRATVLWQGYEKRLEPVATLAHVVGTTEWNSDLMEPVMSLIHDAGFEIPEYEESDMDDPITFWPSTTTASYPVESPPFTHLPRTEADVDEAASPFVD